MEMNSEEKEIANSALEFVKNHENKLVTIFCGTCIPVEKPVSLFMAGSPGAGKTEVSISLMKRFETIPVRIDADEIRKQCPGYTGTNAHIFQLAANKGVNFLHDYALNHNFHLILDGTFAYAGWQENIERSLKRKRLIEVWFIHQDPLKAWEFTKAREAIESRRVDKEAFIHALLLARHNVIEAKRTYDTQITLNLLMKEFDNKDGELKLNIQASELDPYIGTPYTEDKLNSLIK